MSDPYPHARPGRHGTRQPRPRSDSSRPPQGEPRNGRRRWLRLPVLIAAAGVVVVLAAGAVLAATTGTFSKGHLTVHGTEQVVVTSFDGMSTERAFPDITSGTPVTVVDPAGTVIGSASLAASDPSSWGPQDAVYAFVVTVPAGERRYGIEIGRNRGTTWFTEAQLRQGPALSVSG